MSFSSRLKDLMSENEISQLTLANKINYNQTSISLWLSGKSEPKMSALVSLANFFQCTTDYLTERSDDFGNITIVSDSAPKISEQTKQAMILFEQLPPSRQKNLIIQMQDTVDAIKLRESKTIV